MATNGAGQTSAKSPVKLPTLEEALRCLKPGAPVFVQFMEAPSDLNFFDAVVQKVSDKTLTLQFVTKTPPENINDVNIHYRDEKKQFVSVQADVQLNLHTQPLATYQVLLKSPPKAADRRSAFRVSVVNLQMIAEVGDFPSCQILDMSFDTIGVITTGPLTVDDTVQVQFFYGGEQVLGTMRVRVCNDRGNGTYRCGLQAYGKVQQFKQKLQNVTMDVQRNQLRRLSAMDAGKQMQPGEETQADPKNVQLTLILNADALIGKPIPGDLCDTEGNRYAKAGAVLTEEQVLALATKPLKITTDWITKTRPASEDENSNGQSGSGKTAEELRQHERMEWATESVVQICAESDKRKLTVMTHDVSASGFSFKCNTYIHVGSPLEMTVNIDGQTVRLSGIVMNCILLGAPNHRVGVKLTKREILGKAKAG